MSMLRSSFHSRMSSAPLQRPRQRTSGDPVRGQGGGRSWSSGIGAGAWRHFAAPALLLLTLSRGAAAEVQFESLPEIDPALEAKGWRLLTRSDITPNRFRLRDDRSIEVRSLDSNALIYKPVGEDQRFPQRFRWRWRVERSTPPTDIRVKGGDDRPVSVYLGFEAPPGSRGFFNSLKNVFSELIVGVPVSGYALTYTWGGTSPVGTMFNNPHLRDDSYVFVRRNQSAPLMRWLAEEIDVAADFQAAFGRPPTALRFIAIAADSEDTGHASVARVADLNLVGGVTTRSAR